jgi:hypothetical protein
MTVAALGLVVDSSDVAQATPALQKLAAAATEAETAARGLSGGAQTAAGSARALDAANENAAVSTGRAAAASRVYTSALQAEAAALRMANMQRGNLIFQLNDIGVSLASGMNPLLVAIQQGSQIATIYGPGEGGIGRALLETAKMASRAVLPLGALALAVGAVTSEVNRNQEQQVSWGDVVMATWQLASEEIVRRFKPVTNTIGGWWNTASPYIAEGVNRTIGIFDFGAKAITTIWTKLPAAIGDLSIQAANAALAAVDDLLNKNRARTQAWMTQMATVLGPVLGAAFQAGGGALAGMPNIDVTPIDNPLAGSASGLASGLAGDFQDTMGTDYLGAIGDRAREIALLGEEAEEAGEKLKAANDNGRDFSRMLSDVEPLLRNANDPLLQLQDNLYKLGELLAAGEISWDEYSGAVHRANLSAASGVLGAVGQITGALAGAFEDNKAFAVANAVINTAEGVTKALAQGGIFGFASAAAIGIAGAAQVASILSAKPGSASTAAVPSAPAASTTAGAGGVQQAVNVTLRGENFSRESVERLLGTITDIARDGGAMPLIKVFKAA